MDEVTFHRSYQTEANPSAPSPVEQEKRESYVSTVAHKGHAANYKVAAN